MGPSVLIGVRVVDAKKGRFTYWTARNYRVNTPLRCQPPSKLRDVCVGELDDDEGTCTLRRQKVPGAEWPFFFIELQDSRGVYGTTGVATSDGKSFAVVSPVLDKRLKDEMYFPGSEGGYWISA